MNILIIAAHPDDEVLGIGATIKKLSKTNNVSLLVVSEGASSQYDDKKMISVRHNACLKSSKFLGIKNVKFLDQVIKYDRKQPEFYEDTKTYIGKRTSKNKLNTVLPSSRLDFFKVLLLKSIYLSDSFKKHSISFLVNLLDSIKWYFLYTYFLFIIKL